MTPISTLSDATEAKCMATNMQGHLVGDEGATGCLIAYRCGIRTTSVAKIVDGKRLVPIIDELDDLTNILERKDGHDRSKNLLLHQLRVQIRLQNHRRLDMAHFLVHFTSTNKCSTGAIDQIFDSISMEVIDHFSLILCAFRLALPIHLLESDLDPLYEVFNLGLVHEDVVGSDADLPRVESLPEGGLCSREVNLSIVVDDHWALASQLKDARRQVLGGSLCDQFANLSRPCEAYEIEGQLVERDSDVDTTFEAYDELRVQIRVDKLFDHGATIRTDL